jgi:hypothetical protein
MHRIVIAALALVAAVATVATTATAGEALEAGSPALPAFAGAKLGERTAAAAVRVGQPFPSNLFTELDFTQATGLRVDLPKPDCAVRPSDCADIDAINTLDGFNIQPRISIPFSGPIDVSTVSSAAA